MINSCETTTSPKAVCLLSGGLDSSTTIYAAKDQGFELFALSFSYGQRNQFEINSARAIAERAGVKEHRIIAIDLASFGGSSLTTTMEVAKDRLKDEIGQGIPLTYVPCRNTIFLSYAMAWAEVLKADNIFIGVNALDFSGYPDCRPAYIEAFANMANLASKRTIEDGMNLTINAPLINLSKAEIITLGLDLGVPYELTISCYDPSSSGQSCGRCDACLLRLSGFKNCNATDPITYQ